MSELSQLPWDSIRRAYRHLRKLLFTTPRSGGPYFLVDADLDEITEVLGQHSYAPNWEFSYNYRGEDLNLAQVVHHRSKTHPDAVWWQTHVRGWGTEDRVELQAHWETEPTENDSAHLEGHGLEVSIGMKNLREVLDEEGLEYEKFER